MIDDQWRASDAHRPEAQTLDRRDLRGPGSPCFAEQ